MNRSATFAKGSVRAIGRSWSSFGGCGFLPLSTIPSWNEPFSMSPSEVLSSQAKSWTKLAGTLSGPADFPDFYLGELAENIPWLDDLWRLSHGWKCRQLRRIQRRHVETQEEVEVNPCDRGNDDCNKWWCWYQSSDQSVNLSAANECLDERSLSILTTILVSCCWCSAPSLFSWVMWHWSLAQCEWRKEQQVLPKWVRSATERSKRTTTIHLMKKLLKVCTCTVPLNFYFTCTFQRSRYFRERASILSKTPFGHKETKILTVYRWQEENYWKM